MAHFDPAIHIFQSDAGAATRGPGLLGSLLVGTTTARILASIWQKPLIGVHHTLGHLSSPWLAPPNQKPVTLRPGSKQGNTQKLVREFPLLALSVSGGHTDLWLRESHTRGTLLGRTGDDAAGEAFDKGASMLGLPYPGGPSIAKAAMEGDPRAFAFPLPLHGEETLDFSFSGLKTSLKYLLRDLETKKQEPLRWNSGQARQDVAASYEFAICAHLLDRIRIALKRFPDANEVHMVGGVSANARLRELLSDLVRKKFPAVTVRFPAVLAYCTDNAAMIAAAGYFLWKESGQQAFASFETAASLPLALG